MASILVVEDDQAIAQMIKLILGKHNHQLKQATNGEEALTKLENAGRFDLVILDLNMPKLGGEETLKRIRQDPNLDTMPVIILTGDSNDEVQKRLLELGADDFIEKGAPPELFVSRLKAQIRFKITTDRLTAMAMDTDIFAAGVLHDIRNLESNIISICHIAKVLLNEDPVTNKDGILSEVAALKEQATRIGTYAHDIIQMVRDTRTRINIESCSIKTVLTWTKGLLFPHTGNLQNYVEWTEIGELAAVSGDEKFLKLAFFNIIQNAVKYAKPGQKPRIEISQVCSAGGLGNQGNMVTTYIRDHGLGIPPEELKRVFKPFVKGSKNTSNDKTNGFGLGLSLVMKVVTAMKGRVWAEVPTDGDGTVFCIALPSATS
jgi:signal transduction histidine kinase